MLHATIMDAGFTMQYEAYNGETCSHEQKAQYHSRLQRKPASELQGYFGAGILLCKNCRQIDVAAASAEENRQTCIGWAVMACCRLCMLAQ